MCEYAPIRVTRVWRVFKLNPLVGIIPKVIPPELFLYMVPSLPADNRELNHARFWDVDDNRKWAIFTVNSPSHNHIHIAKYLFSIRDK